MLRAFSTRRVKAIDHCVMAEAAGRTALLALYREVRRVHRGLPPPMRALGDRYVRDEFDRHRAASTTAGQWRAFGAEWSKYCAQLRGTAVPGGAVRRSSELLSAEAIQDMSVDQQQQLIKLHDEAVRLGAALTPPMPPPH